MYTFVDDKFMPPDDPYGRNGPTLDNLLKMSTSFTAGAGASVQQPCPYGKKCTYGNKCKFYHAERGNVPMKTVTDKLKVGLPICMLICPGLQSTFSGAIQETDPGGEDKEHLQRLVPG